MFIVHVGPQKTATTWLQHNFFHNRNTLLEAGWLYPSTGIRVRVAHHDISDNPRQIMDVNGAKFRQIREIAQYATANGKNVLLSSEGFRSWNAAQLSQLRRAIFPHEMEIVYTLRDPISVLYSYWMQSVKNGNVRSFPEFCALHMRQPTKSRLLNPMRELKAISSVEATKLTLISYEDIKRQKRDIFDVFATEILKLHTMPHADRSVAGNDSLPIELIEFTRLWLIRMGNWKARSKVSMGQMLKRIVADETKARMIEVVANAASAKREMTLDRDQKVFRNIEQTIVRQFADHFTPPLVSKEIFLRGADTYTYYDADVLIEDRNVAELLEKVTRKYRPGGLMFTALMLGTNTVRNFRRLRKRF